MELLNRLIKMDKEDVARFLFSLGDALELPLEVNTVQINGVENILFWDNDFEELMLAFKIDWHHNKENNTISFVEQGRNYVMVITTIPNRFMEDQTEEIFILDTLKEVK